MPLACGVGRITNQIDCGLAFALLRSRWLGVFSQLVHLHLPAHAMPAWKHSQYFFLHADFLQWQPFECLVVPPLMLSIFA